LTEKEKINRKKRIAIRLKAAREATGLSQGQVSRLLNYHRPTISEMEAGRRSLKAEEVFEFCYLYKITYECLLT